MPAEMRVSDSKKFQKRPVARFLFFPSKKSAGGEGVPMSGFERLDRLCFHGARDGAPEGKRNGNYYRHGCRTKEMIEVWKLIKSLADVAFSLVNRSTARDSRLRCVSSPRGFSRIPTSGRIVRFRESGDWLAD